MPRKPPQQVERTAAGPVRCAIYTRKSSEEGLEQPFNSLDAQREAAEAYIGRRVSSTLRHLAWEFSDFLPLSFGRLGPAC